MPDKQPAKAATSVAPTQSWFQRTFGSDPFTPEQQEGIRIAKKEDPNIGEVNPYGFFSRLMGPSNSLAYVSPGKSIYMDPRANAGQSPQQIADTIIHEQTHVNQYNRDNRNPVTRILGDMFSSKGPYHQRPDELEAFQVERDRRARQNAAGIPRGTNAQLSFMTGKPYFPQDVNLPSPKKSVGPTIDVARTNQMRAAKGIPSLPSR